MTTELKSQPIKRHGGKSYLAKMIVSLMPPRCTYPNGPAPDDGGWLHYVEPYFGGGAVLFANDPEGISEVVNDLDGDLTAFWETLQHDSAFEIFKRKISMIPLSETEFNRAGVCYSETLGRGDGKRKIGQAIDFFVRNRQSRQGLEKDFATMTRNRTRRGMNEQVSSWLSAIDGLEWFHERLQRVVIFNRDALDVIKQQDGKRTLYYCDPPYVHKTRSSTGEYGEHEMSDDQHRELLKALAGIAGRFLLSGYHSELYDGFAAINGWRCHEKEIDNKASSAKEKKKQIECVWTNYASVP
jgi:DNA adenine methylase